MHRLKEKTQTNNTRIDSEQLESKRRWISGDLETSTKPIQNESDVVEWHGHAPAPRTIFVDAYQADRIVLGEGKGVRRDPNGAHIEKLRREGLCYCSVLALRIMHATLAPE